MSGKNGSAENVGILVAAWLTLAGITAVFGQAAAMWFAAGLLISAVVFLWEAGANKRASSQDMEPTDV